MSDIDGDLFDSPGEHERVEFNADGVPSAEDFGVDIAGDGVPGVEMGAVDFDGDDHMETTYVVVDADGDGHAEFTAMGVDISGDGVADAAALFGGVDGNDVLALSLDTDVDGRVDMFAVGDEARQIWGDVATSDTEGAAPVVSEHAEAAALDSFDCCDALTATHEDLTFEGYEAYYELHGTPAEDMQLWDQQDAPYSCAVATTSMMYRSFGVDFGEDALANVLQQWGVYDPAAGSDPHAIDDAINLISAIEGIDARALTVHAHSFEDFAALLDAGFKPMVAIDTYEIEAGAMERHLNDAGLLPDAGHAVQLTGVESTPNGAYAILNDPARGAGFRVPFDVFLDASEDYNGACVVMGNTGMLAVFNSAAPENASHVILGNKVPLTIDPLSKHVYAGDSLFPLC